MLDNDSKIHIAHRVKRWLKRYADYWREKHKDDLQKHGVDDESAQAVAMQKAELSFLKRNKFSAHHIAMGTLSVWDKYFIAAGKFVEANPVISLPKPAAYPEPDKKETTPKAAEEPAAPPPPQDELKEMHSERVRKRLSPHIVARRSYVRDDDEGDDDREVPERKPNRRAYIDWKSAGIRQSKVERLHEKAEELKEYIIELFDGREMKKKGWDSKVKKFRPMIGPDATDYNLFDKLDYPLNRVRHALARASGPLWAPESKTIALMELEQALKMVHLREFSPPNKKDLRPAYTKIRGFYKELLKTFTPEKLDKAHAAATKEAAEKKKGKASRSKKILGEDTEEMYEVQESMGIG